MAEQVKDEIVELNGNPSVLTLAEDVAGPLVIADNQIEVVLNADTSSAYQAVVDFDDLFSGKPVLRAIANDPDDGAAPHIPRYTPWSQLHSPPATRPSPLTAVEDDDIRAMFTWFANPAGLPSRSRAHRRT
jgi:hypothetical protein